MPTLKFYFILFLILNGYFGNDATICSLVNPFAIPDLHNGRPKPCHSTVLLHFLHSQVIAMLTLSPSLQTTPLSLSVLSFSRSNLKSTINGDARWPPLPNLPPFYHYWYGRLLFKSFDFLHHYCRPCLMPLMMLKMQWCWHGAPLSFYPTANNVAF